MYNFEWTLVEDLQPNYVRFFFSFSQIPDRRYFKFEEVQMAERELNTEVKLWPGLCPGDREDLFNYCNRTCFTYSSLVLPDKAVQWLRFYISMNRLNWVMTKSGLIVRVCLCVRVWTCFPFEADSCLCLCFPVTWSWWLTLGKCISAMIGGVTVTPPRDNHIVSTTKLEEGNAYTHLVMHTHTVHALREVLLRKRPCSCPSAEWSKGNAFKYRNINTCTHLHTVVTTCVNGP